MGDSIWGTDVTGTSGGTKQLYTHAITGFRQLVSRRRCMVGAAHREPHAELDAGYDYRQHWIGGNVSKFTLA
jgi:hypothetical protein